MTIAERIELKDKTIELMREYPKNLHMAWTVGGNGVGTGSRIKEGFPCGTTCCIAGFICVAAYPRAKYGEVLMTRAKKLLGLDWDLAESLFLPNDRRVFLSEGHDMDNRDVEVAISALEKAVEIQNLRDMGVSYE